MAVPVYSCPSLAHCTWQGQRHEIVDHFQAKHVELLLRSNEFRVAVPDLPLDNKTPDNCVYDYAINYLLVHDDEVYLVQNNVTNGVAAIKIRYSGGAEVANKKRFSIQVVSGDLSLWSNAKCNNFYSAVRKRSGQIEIDTLFLRTAWKVPDFLICRIYFDASSVPSNINEASEIAEVETRREVVSVVLPKATNQCLQKSKSLDELISPSVAEDGKEAKQSRNNNTGAIRKKVGHPLVRSESEQSYSFSSIIPRLKPSGSKIFKRTSFYKSDQSIFYPGAEFLDSAKVDGLINLAEERIELLKNFLCVRCMFYILGPIYRCVNEHSICHACLEEHGACSCSAGLSTDQRCATLERSRDLTKLPCRFDGCGESVLGSQLQAHQLRCNQCVYRCPECNEIIGKHGEVEKHFRIRHPSVKIVKTLINPLPSNVALLVSHEQGVFYCQSKVEENNVDWKIEHCGHIKIYFECKVSTKKTTHQLDSVKGGNVLRRSISIREKKQKPASLIIIVYVPHT